MPTSDAPTPPAGSEKDRKLPDLLRDVEKSIETGVKRTLARTKLPRRDEVDALRARAAALASRLDALQKQRKGAR